MEEFATERKAAAAIAERYDVTPEELRQYHDYSFSDLIDAYWIGYQAAAKESRP